GQHDLAFEVRRERAEVKRRAAESAELVFKAAWRERLFFGGDEGDLRFEFHDVALAIVEDERERGAGVAVDFRIDGAGVADLFALEGGAQFTVERGVVVFPEKVAGFDATEMDVAMAE